MKKDTMRAYAVVGIRARLLDVERELHDMYKEFPDAFLSPPPQLARPELKNGASRNGRGLPPIVLKPSKSPSTKPAAYHRPAAVLRRRKKTAAVLARAAKADKPLPASAFGDRASVLIQRGYLKKTSDGLIRTDKPFVVDRR